MQVSEIVTEAKNKVKNPVARALGGLSAKLGVKDSTIRKVKKFFKPGNTKIGPMARSFNIGRALKMGR